MKNNSKLNQKRNRESDMNHNRSYNYDEGNRKIDRNNTSISLNRSLCLESSYYPNQNRFKSKVTTKQEISHSETKNKVMHIPGYYYDESTNRYFPEKNFHNKEFSQFNQEKNERKCKENISKLNITYTNSQENKLSTFLFLKNNKLGIKSRYEKEDFLKRADKNQLDQFNLLDIKTKSNGSKYDLYLKSNRTYLLTLENNQITIQNIIDSDNYSAVIYKIYFNYTKTITDFRVVNDFLFIFNEFRVFGLDISGILGKYEKGLFTFQINVFYQNFTNNLNKICNFPRSYLWPIIHNFDSDKSFIFLFFKKIFTVDFNIKQEDNSISSNNTKEIYIDKSIINLNEIIKEKSFNFIKIHTEKTFDNYFFTEIRYNPQTELFFCGESMGNIHIYDKYFKLLEIIHNPYEKQSSIINLIPIGKEMISIESNSNIELIQSSGSQFLKTCLYKSSLQSYFKPKNPCVVINKVKIS